MSVLQSVKDMLSLSKHKHVCRFVCTGYNSYYQNTANIQDSIDDKESQLYFFPNNTVRMIWMSNGETRALVFKSTWKCVCGRLHTFLFLDCPAPALMNQISIKTFERMKKNNPFNMENRPMSLEEFVQEYTKKPIEVAIV